VQQLAGQRQQMQQVNQGRHQHRCTSPVFDDPRGGLPRSVPRRPWSGVWQRLHRVPAPRAHRFLAWQILHATLMCGLRYASHLGRWQDVREHAFCQLPGCAEGGACDSISHIFLECPIAQRVTAWVCQLWSAVTEGQPPPCSAAVFLLGDRGVWDPGGAALRDLWDVVRLAAIFFLWEARGVSRQRSQPATALSVIAYLVEYLRARIREDALRAFPPSPDLAAPHGAHVRLTPEGFVARWCHRGVLCSLSPAGVPVVHLRLTRPVPPPASIS
jgi:hypothetical protein